MTPLDAMKQAIEALEIWSDAKVSAKGRAAIANLRTAIAEMEAAEPVAQVVEAHGYDKTSKVSRVIDWFADDVECLPIGTQLFPHPAPLTIPANLDEIAVEVGKGIHWALSKEKREMYQEFARRLMERVLKEQGEC